jgi:hypothetical protein
LDIEWLLSTLFDASLLSTSSRRQRRLFFVDRFHRHRFFRAKRLSSVKLLVDQAPFDRASNYVDD